MRLRIPKMLAGGVTAALLTAAIGGVALAQTAPASPSGTPGGTSGAAVSQRAQDFLAALAAKLGKTPDELKSAITSTARDQVAKDVQAGRLTADQAAQANRRIDQSGGLGIIRGFEGGRGHREGFGDDGPGKGRFEVGRAGLSDLATFLGVQLTELQQALTSGKSLAQVAVDRGKSRDDLKAHLTAQAKARLDAAVTAGKITRAQADQMLATGSSQIDQMIDHVGPVGGKRGPGGPDGGRGKHGGQGPRPNGPAAPGATGTPQASVSF